MKECIEFSQSCTRVREFIVGLMTIRRSQSEQCLSKEKNRDALQCLLEHSDSDWNDKNIVEYVSHPEFRMLWIVLTVVIDFESFDPWT
jgi:hypothetical protein